jgi:hypothetical protein
MEMGHHNIRAARLGFLCIALLLVSLAKAAPDCTVTFRDITLNIGPLFIKEHGYCVMQELSINESNHEWITRTTYESGKVVDYVITATEKKNLRFGTKDEYGIYGPDSWPDDEYTSYLPKPAMPAYMAAVVQGKGKETGEWTFNALFIDKEGKLMDGMRAYIKQLKTMGFTRDAHDKEILSKNIGSNTAQPPGKPMLLTYRAGNNAGFLAAVLCGTGGKLCHLRLDNPRRAYREAGKKATRKAKEEKERKRKQKFDDDFFDFSNSLPGE